MGAPRRDAHSLRRTSLRTDGAGVQGGARRGRALRAGLAVTLALAALLGGKAAAGLADAAVDLAVSSSTVECKETTITALSEADAWIAENSTSNKGSDAILNVEANPSSGNSRALVRFGLPGGVPEGCVVESAMLRLFSSEADEGSRVEVVRLGSGWLENGVVWSDQPGTVGGAAAAWSREGYIQWRVASQVQAMLEGENHGFLVRVAAEGTIEGGAGHGFYSREKGENPPQLVIRFAAPSSGEPPGPPEPPVLAAVSCGQVLTQSTRVTNDLVECPDDGLVIGADNIIVDLDGHTIDGVGLGTGILNDGYASVTVTNGTVQQFDRGVELLPETRLNRVEKLRLERNELAAVELFDAEDNEVRANTVEENGDGIALVSGTRGSVVADNTLTGNSGPGLLVVDSSGNRLERNRVSGSGDLGIGLQRASGNTLFGNTVSDNSDGGIEIRYGSNANRVERNEVVASGDTGIMVDESDRNELISNTTRLMSDSGITLNGANDGVVQGNDARFSPGGLELDGSSRNLIDSNDASNTSGNGIELGGGSYGNVIVGNSANANAASGIYLADEASSEPGNLLSGNTASGNRADGIVVAKGGHTITTNVTRANSGWGIHTTGANIDGLGNVATGNGQAQECFGIVCKAEWDPPETTIVAGPEDPTSSTSASFRFGGSDDTTPPSALRFECRLDSEKDTDFAACSSPRGYAGLSHGSHTFDVRAIDAAGNVDPTPARYAWTVGVAAPETTIDAGPDAITRSTLATFVFSADELGSAFECSLDGAPFEPCVSPAEYGGLSGGAHEFQVRATDPAGNVEPEPAIHVWTVDSTPPETTIEAGPDDPTNTTSATLRFEADEEGVGFACSLDGGVFVDCSSPVEYTGLGAGQHSFRVLAADRAGNVEQEPAGYAWTIDLTAPESTIGERPPDPSNQGSASLVFAGSDDLSEAAALRFQCRLDAGSDWAACASPQRYDDLAEARHSFEVRAIDQAGNVDASPAAHAWTIDLTAPQTAISSAPSDPSNDHSPSFELASSEDGSSFECRLDAGAWGSCSSPQAYGPLADGAHNFEARATDRAGNTDGSAAVHGWTVDTVAPETTIGSGPSGPTRSTDATFVFAAGEESVFECRLDGGGWASCSSPHAYSGLAVGAHAFEVRATDRAGNVDLDPAISRWTVEEPSTPAPDTTITAAPPALTSSASASFGFTSSATGSTFECELDAGGWAACSSPQVYGALGDGPHTFRVRAIDAAGTVDGSPAVHGWRVDTVAPETAITAAPPSLTSSGSASFAFAAGEPGATFECSLDGAAFAACVSPRAYSGLADGSHDFRVRAVDAAGNVDESPAAGGWRVDTVAPETTIGSAPAATTASTSATFAFSAGEPGSTFECSLDGEAFAACLSPREYTGLAAAGHEFRVRARDAAGNVDASPASYTWTIQPSGGCAGPSTVTAGAGADSWVLESSPSSNYGDDSVVKVDTKAGANARALFRFTLPAIPAGCQVTDARLRLFATSYKQGRTLQALQLAGGWIESGVTWSNQPATMRAAAAAASPSTSSYVQWSVTSQVQSMYSSGNHGFLIQENAENGNGIEQAFHSREKAPDNPPQLVISFG